MIIDTHMHTNFSDGKNSVNEMAEEASKTSLEVNLLKAYYFTLKRGG